ncbi:hypothetical protein RHMOL_Rhmol07G0217800 [Rhododendron molle]|uniref:Uncharacterized protein n=1 Tax=Rhododendron molle TaxID=49168 RepID=A0ACC0N569_RHOML|nr:hypothetical protein RHMOL_Rhmol07G0217800 [Rhododendron molle]
MMSRNVRFSRFYLCSRRNMTKIIPEGMYDSEKWASDYVEVRGNYQFPPAEYGQFEVAKARGNPNTTRINKNLLRFAKGCGLADSLLTIPREERDTPTILQYDATYGGRIRGKGAEGNKRKKSYEVDLTELPEDLFPSPSAPTSKRVKSHALKASAGQGDARVAKEKAKEPEKGASSEMNIPWQPSLMMPGKKQILKSDSLQEDPSLGFTLHARLMLPKDIVAPTTLKTALSEYYFHFGRATQSIMSDQYHLTKHDKQAKLLRQKVEASQNTTEDYKKSLEQSEELRQSQDITIANLNNLVKGLQDLVDRTRAEGKDEGFAEGRAQVMQEGKEMKKQLQEQFDKGYFQAEEDVAEELLALQTELKDEQHKKSFLLGFNMGFDEAGVEPDDERRSLVEVPPLEAAKVQDEPPATDKAAADATQQKDIPAPMDEPGTSPTATQTPEA